MLAALGIEADALLGHGGEASVFALDADRVARINNRGAEHLEARAAFGAELRRSADRVPFAIPEVLETREIAGHVVTIERRLPGRDLMAVLDEASADDRVALIHAYLEAAARIGDLAIERPWCGELVRGDAIRLDSFETYLEARATANLRAGGVGGIDSGALASELTRALEATPTPEGGARALVHLDAFPGNMLGGGSTGTEVTAVLDFSVIALVGDRRLDPLAGVAYLDPRITPVATDADRAVAQGWLRARGLEGAYEPARRWLAAFWSFAVEDARLQEWTRDVLEG